MGERRYSSYSFLTSALDGGDWSASRPGRALPPGKGPPIHIVQGAVWAPEPVWTQRLEEKSVVQSVVRHYTARATAAHNQSRYYIIHYKSRMPSFDRWRRKGALNMVWGCVWTGIIRFSKRFCEHGNEHSGSIKVGEFFWQAERVLDSQERFVLWNLIDIN
jgi:hypothetical protein